MTDFAQLITILVTAVGTLGVTLITTWVNRRFAKADEREVYKRNTKREDSLRFERDTIRLVTELLATTERIFDATNTLTALGRFVEIPEVKAQKQQTIQGRLKDLQMLKVQLTEAMFFVPERISMELNRVVQACQATMQEMTEEQHVSAGVAYVEAKANLIGHLRHHLGVEEPAAAEIKKSTPRWSALKLHRKS